MEHDLQTYEGLLAAIEELTPMGSEYYQDPKACLKWLREKDDRFIETVRERNLLRNQLGMLNHLCGNCISLRQATGRY